MSICLRTILSSSGNTLSTDHRILTGYINREQVKLIENRKIWSDNHLESRQVGLGGSGQQGTGNTISDNQFFYLFLPVNLLNV